MNPLDIPLVFGEKPHTMQFAEGVTSVIKEADLEPHGVVSAKWLDHLHYNWNPTIQ